MQSMIGKTFWLALLALLWVAAGGSAAGATPPQGYGQGQQNPPKPPPPQPAPITLDTPSAPAPNLEEDAALKTFTELKREDVARQIELGEEFLKKYPGSRYNAVVYARLAPAYLAVAQEDKMFAAGEKALELNPDNVDILALMGMLLPRRAGTLDADQKLQKAEKYSKRTIELLAAMQKPDGLTEEEFNAAKNQKLSMAHSGLGLTYLQRQRYGDSVAELEQATKLVKEAEPTDFYLLGVAYQKAQRFSDAATAFGKCGEAQWGWQDRCKKGAEDSKKLAATQPQPPKP